MKHSPRVSAALALAAMATTAAAAYPVVLSGSGSTFVHPMMSRWIAAFARRVDFLWWTHDGQTMAADRGSLHCRRS